MVDAFGLLITSQDWPSISEVNFTPKATLEAVGVPETVEDQVIKSPADTLTLCAVSFAEVAVSDIVAVRVVSLAFFLNVNMRLVPAPGAASNPAYKLDNVPEQGATVYPEDSVERSVPSSGARYCVPDVARVEL